MAKPDLKDAAFPDGLHKKKGNRDKGTVTANTPLVKDWAVKVTGHKGKKPTVWVGKVGDPTGTKDTWEIVDLAVTDEQQRSRDDQKDDKKDRDTEDVSTTVTNPTATPAESQPVITPGVKTIP